MSSLWIHWQLKRNTRKSGSQVFVLIKSPSKVLSVIKRRIAQEESRDINKKLGESDDFVPRRHDRPIDVVCGPKNRFQSNHRLHRRLSSRETRFGGFFLALVITGSFHKVVRVQISKNKKTYLEGNFGQRVDNCRCLCGCECLKR